MLLTKRRALHWYKGNTTVYSDVAKAINECVLKEEISLSSSRDVPVIDYLHICLSRCTRNPFDKNCQSLCIMNHTQITSKTNCYERCRIGRAMLTPCLRQCQNKQKEVKKCLSFCDTNRH